MHKEHNTHKWCIALLAVIIAIAVIASIHFQAVPVIAASKTIALQSQQSEHIAQIAEAQDIQPTEEVEAHALSETHAVSEAVSVTLKADGQEMDLMTAPVTVAEVLEVYNIPLGKDDIIGPAVDQQVKDGMEIVINRITFEEIVESEAIPFKTKTKGTDELPAGTKKVVQEGQKGEDKVTYKITYSDGKEIAREETARETVKEPVTKIIEKSTVGTINGKEYSKKFTVKAYSYTGGGTTASGLPAAHGRIAVDPSVIPLGTKVYVEGYGFATAADTGGNINGKTIDVYYNSKSQCINWGCRNVTIYILK